MLFDSLYDSIKSTYINEPKFVGENYNYIQNEMKN
jgi:hypothetical protein